MDRNSTLFMAALGFAGSVGFASAVAIQQELPPEVLGLRIPVSVPTGVAIGLGAGIAAPWPMPVAALLAATKAGDGHGPRWPARFCVCLGVSACLGQLVEPLIRHPESWTPAVRIALLLNFASSAGLAGAGLLHMKTSGVWSTRNVP